MKKILHISKYYYPFIGGIEQTARDCVESLKDKYNQKVICFNNKKGNVKEIIDNVEVIRCSCECKFFSQSISLSYGRKLKQIIKEFKPDIIIFHYPNPFVAYFLLKYLDSNTKLVLYWHLDIIKQKNIGKLFYFQNKRLITKAYRIIATSPMYITGSPWLSLVKNKCFVIPSCINELRLKTNALVLEKSKQIRDENKGKIICLSVGRHTEYKGTQYLIEASKLLSDNYVIYIAGNGELTEKLMELAKDDKKVRFLGLISDDELKAYLTACDIFCFPSITKNEAFGLALAEAMYYKKPAVTFTIPGSGVNFVSIDNETGIQVENKNTKKYAEAIEKLGTDKSLRNKYGQNAYNRVINNFLLRQYKENIIKFIQTL